jgi:dipeptidyl aminopeptidase/acylaminoacyl peptidase
MNADGSGVTRVTTSPAFDADPAWSPDTKIVFSSNRDGSGSIYTMNADGSGVTQVSAGPADGTPAWSPDGSQIAFGRTVVNPDTGDYNQTIHVVGIDGTGERQIYIGTAMNPDWSPDGSKIAFDSLYAVWVVNADGTGALPIASGPSTPNDPYPFNRNPAWSPDGTRIAFEHSEYGFGRRLPGELETVNPDGGQRSGFLATGSEPDWQPIAPANQPPDCSGVTATPDSLPHHGFQTVTLAGATDPDGDTVTITIDGVTQDEPVGRRSDARAGQSADQVELRGQRRPRGNGRVYRIAFTVSDGKDECSGLTTVEVRRKKKQPAVDSAPPSYNSFE